jgi:asparagine synthase (glutamine-hydrolysing)
MGAIAAAINKKVENVVPQVALMLRELKHRGADAYGIATPNSVRLAKSIEQIEQIAAENLNSNIALGHNLSRIFSDEEPQPILSSGYAFEFEGHVFPSSNISIFEGLLRKPEFDIQRNCARIIKEIEGSYVFGVASSDRLIVGRDTLGTTPLYYGENETTYAVASERKALWKIGIKNAKSFPPGNLAEIDAKGFAYQPIQTIRQPSIKSVDIESAAKHLQNLLIESTRKRVSDVKKIAIAFSGGLDSSVIAVLAKLCETEVHLISVGLANQEEIQHAKKAAEALNLPHHVHICGIDQVREILPQVLWLIEQPNTVNVCIAIPFYWVAAAASHLGCHILLAGQGGDELFGGYQRYLTKYRQGIASVNEAIYHDVAYSYETNFQRDNQIFAFHKVELRLPFIDSHVLQYALSLPINLKIESAEDILRKRVLRKVAQNLKLPSSIVNRRKKAIQYATGVDKALRKLAKEEGLTLQKYIEKTFQKVYPEVEV